MTAKRRKREAAPEWDASLLAETILLERWGAAFIKQELDLLIPELTEALDLQFKNGSPLFNKATFEYLHRHGAPLDCILMFSDSPQGFLFWAAVYKTFLIRLRHMACNKWEVNQRWDIRNHHALLVESKRRKENQTNEQ